MRIIHPIPPFYHEDSRVLILGSFPSVKSRESGFFYGHPQNRFWRLMTLLLEGAEAAVPQTVEDKADFLLRHKIACWDSIHACEITGSSDASIKDVEPNDFTEILQTADIRHIYTNGKKSHEIYRRYCLSQTGREDICLPSTSPANAAWTLEKLADAWRCVAEDLRGYNMQY